jgi:capsid protein
VDPLKYVQAGILAVAARFRSRDEIIGEMGGDFEDVAEQLSEEEKIADQYGLALPATIEKPKTSLAGSEKEADDESDEDGEDKEGSRVLEAVRALMLPEGRSE